MSFNPFPIGTQLHVETCFGDQLTGEVVTYEHSVKMLILSCPAKDAKGNNCRNRCIINLDFCKDLHIIQESKPSPPDILSGTPARLNLQHVCIMYACSYPLHLTEFLSFQLDQRLQQTVEQREYLLRSRNELASPCGRQLFQFLSKHFGQNEVKWQLESIVVLQQVVVTPPYHMCDISTTRNCPKLLNYVQRLVAKFHAQLAPGDRIDSLT